MAREFEDALARRLVQENATMLTDQTLVVTVVVQRVWAAEIAAGGPVRVTVPERGMSVSVPAAVLDAVGGDTIISIAAFNVSTKDSFEPTPTGAALAAAPVSVRVRQASSLEDANFSAALPAEITVSLLPSSPQGARCAFWNEAAQRWSSLGLTEAVGTNGSFACTTSHLTIFASILEEFERAILCSNIHVFSNEGMQNIFRGEWYARAPAVFLWTILVVQLIVLSWTAYADWSAYVKAVWRDEDFLTENEAFADSDMSWVTWFLDSFIRYLPSMGDLEDHGAAGVVVSPGGTRKESVSRRCCGYMRATMDSVCITLTTDCAHLQVARQERISPTDLKDLVIGMGFNRAEDVRRTCPCGDTYEGDERFCGTCGAPRVGAIPATPSSKQGFQGVVGQAVARTVQTIAEAIRDNVPDTLQDFMTSGFGARVWRTYAALHPWLQLNQFSITLGAFVRALLLTAKILGALMISAVFFDAGGSATGLGSSDECGDESWWAMFWKGLLIGTVSIIFSVVPLLLIACCSNRRFIYNDSWESGQKQSYVLCWRLQDGFMMVLTVFYCGFCTVYCAAFLASIKPAVEGEWIVSTLFVLLEEFLFLPLLLAVLYAGVATMIINRRPELSRLVKQRLDHELGLRHARASSLGTDGTDDTASRWGVPEPDDDVPELLLEGPRVGPEALEEDARGRMAPLTEEAEEPEAPGPLPGVPDPEAGRGPGADACTSCGSRLWAAFGSDICPICGHLLPIKP